MINCTTVAEVSPSPCSTSLLHLPTHIQPLWRCHGVIRPDLNKESLPILPPFLVYSFLSLSLFIPPILLDLASRHPHTSILDFNHGAFPTIFLSVAFLTCRSLRSSVTECSWSRFPEEGGFHNRRILESLASSSVHCHVNSLQCTVKSAVFDQCDRWNTASEVFIAN